MLSQGLKMKQIHNLYSKAKKMLILPQKIKRLICPKMTMTNWNQTGKLTEAMYPHSSNVYI